MSFRAQGMVLVMHSELGMGIEFTQTTDAQRNQLERFIQALTNSNGALPELLVEPEGLDMGGLVRPPNPPPAVKTRCWNCFEKAPTSRLQPSRWNCASNAAPKPRRTRRLFNRDIHSCRSSPRAMPPSVKPLPAGSGQTFCRREDQR